MLFDQKHKKKVQAIWYVIVVLVVVSMILLYMPGIF